MSSTTARPARRTWLSWRLAREELRLRPARFLATLLATTIALAFLVASQVNLATESHSVKQRSAVWASRADVVVATHLWTNRRALSDRDTALTAAEKVLAADPAVTAVARFSQVRSLVTHDARGADLMLTTSVDDPSLQWAPPEQGRTPAAPDEVMLTRQTADDLGARLGDTVQLSRLSGGSLTVVGITEGGQYTRTPAYVTQSFFARNDIALVPPIPGAIPRPEKAAEQTPGSSGQGIGIDLLVSTSDPDGTVARVQTALSDIGILKTVAQPRLATEVVDEAAATSAGGLAWLPWVVTGAAVLALAVGALTITSTYRMLLTARRRQIALLRAVGAHRGQAASWMVQEAGLLWAMSALVAVPVGIGGGWLASALSPGTLTFGLVVPWPRIGLALLAALAVSLAAAAGPAWSASRVAPLEALSHVALPPTHAAQRRATCVSLGLAVVGVALLACGVWLPGWAKEQGALWWTIAGAAVLAAASLLGMRVVGPWAARLVGRVARRPVPVVAAANVSRNPSRTGGAIVAMLVPLLVFAGLLAGASVGRSGAHARLDQLYPVDLSLASAKLDPEPSDPVNGGVDTGAKDSDGLYLGFGPGALNEVTATPGVVDAAMFRTTQPITMIAHPGLFSVLPVAEITPEAARLATGDASLAEGEIGLPSNEMRDLRLNPGDPIELVPLFGNPATLRVVERNLGPEVAAVAPATFAKLGLASKDGLMLVRLDASAATDTGLVERIMARLLPDNPALGATGSVQEKALVNDRIDAVVRLVTALLGIVAVVGVVSVANTLGLAVLERTRESALLRALGTSRAGLRTMVLVEALLMAVVAVAVAVVLGSGLGWLGAEALLGRLDFPRGGFGTSWPALAAGAVATVVAAAVASVVPGAIAARATPVEALADHG
ncbi:FtsX-like permease family protein [Aestuariimicrobium soli]|uniref:FtsX-like permease family protein n=1 Tax=Aestuariimicrobium soli TaxID=2035834 RepID=UPI003EB6B9AB